MYRFFTITTALGLLGCDISVVENNEFVGETLVDTGDVEVADDDCTDPVVVYYDGDGDGFGDAALAVSTCGEVAGHVSQAGDCDDISPNVHPAAEEICNERDDNCDGQVDEGDIGPEWYLDEDGDGFGRSDDTVTACSAPDGFVGQAGDCGDADPLIHPGAADDTCDGVDNDCDDSLDEDAEGSLWYFDGDGDGYGAEAESVRMCLAAEGYVAEVGDCNDADPDIHPGAMDDTCDEVDNDCDDSLDEDAEGTVWFADRDGDGFGSETDTVTACVSPDDHVLVAGDCEDADPDIHPAATDSTCDEIDNDCDDLVDEDGAGTPWFLDADGDGFGDGTDSVIACFAPEAYVASDEDCDDADDAVYPGALDDTCDEVDNNCDGDTDEDAIGSAWYRDADDDGHGDLDVSQDACEAPDGYVSLSDDCDDTDPDIHPGALDDTCDAVDNNCDGDTDEDAIGSTWYRDADDDGHGDLDVSQDACEAPDGYVSWSDDCDDGDPDIHPSALDDTCDAVDNNCDGDTDEDATGSTWYQDADDDGHGNLDVSQDACEAPDGFVSLSDDCDDGDPDIHPTAADDTCDDVDNDCDGAKDEDATGPTWYQDMDSDEHGNPEVALRGCDAPDGYVASDDDCDDENPDIHPGAADDTCDEVDNDCDGTKDEDSIVRTWYKDEDIDGHGHPSLTLDDCVAPPGYVASDDDCDDEDPDIHPGAADDTCDAVDNDCDGDEDEDATGPTWYQDADGDDHGNPEVSRNACDAPEGYVAVGDDCNDTDEYVHPHITADLCDEVDNDCDDAIDEDAAVSSWYPDVDGDYYGSSVGAISVCGTPEDHATSAGDCDDTDPTVYPGASETTCDGVDNDCDDAIDEDAPTEIWFADADDDGFGDSYTYAFSCAAPDGYVSKADDCDDSDPDVHPDRPEVLDGKDNDCSYAIDDLVVEDADTRVDGPTEGGTGFGHALASGRDVTDDGVPDFVVGSASGDRVAIFSGDLSDGVLTMDDATQVLTAADATDGFGASLDFVENFDGDGKIGLVVGVPAADMGGGFSDVGAVRVYQGPFLDGSTAVASHTFQDASVYLLGETVINAHHVTDHSSSAVAASVSGVGGHDGVLIFNSSVTHSDAEWASRILSVDYYDEFGQAMAVADHNGDGTDDLIVGAPSAADSREGTMLGAVYVFHGPLDGSIYSSEADAKISGHEDLAYFGAALSVGDWDGDGSDDVLIGAPHAGDYQGEAFVVPMDSSIGPDETIDLVMVAKLVGVSGELGTATALDGDVDGDGKADALLGAPAHAAYGTDSGAVALFLGGGSGVLSNPDATVMGTAPNQYAGEALGFGTDGSAAAPSGLVIGASGRGTGAGSGDAPVTGSVFLVENAFPLVD